MLTELVEAGELPRLKERLPKEPYVVRSGLLVTEDVLTMEPGRHGGTLRVSQESPDGDPYIFIGMNEPLLWAPNGFDLDAGIDGNVVAGYEANADDTVFTFFLRDGLKWSDGEPVTIEDVRFAFDDVLHNEEITPVFPDYLQAGRRTDAAPAELEVVDDLTFSVRFDRPYGSFPVQVAIAQWRGYAGIIKPRHYLEQFHRKYADPAELSEKLEAESIPEEEWYNLFNAKQFTHWMWNMTTEQGIGHPTLTPWVLVEAGSGVYRYERNPYYFKVDEDGSQLPYIDGIQSQIVQDKATLTARALMGEFDYLGGRASLRQVSMMAERDEREEIRLLVAKHTGPPHAIFLNLTYDDDAWRAVVQDVRFRRALSLAINRDEVIQDIFLGEFATLPESFGQTEHNAVEANRLLDEMGLDAKDDGGFRLGPDGERFTIPFDIRDLTEDHVPVGELVAEYWKNVGVYTTVKQIDSTLYGERAAANDIQATIIWVNSPIWASTGWDDYLPKDNWAPQWHQWYTSRGESGAEPPEEIKELYQLHGDFMAATTGTPESAQLLDAIIENHREHVWFFPMVDDAYAPSFASGRIGNFPSGIKQDVFDIIVGFSWEQWFINSDE